MHIGGSPRDVVATVLVSDILVSAFEFQSSYYDYIRIDTLPKDMNSLITLVRG